MSKFVDKNIVSLLKLICSCYTWMVLSFIAIIPSDYVQAQDPDEEGEIFWGDEDDEGLDEDEFEDDEEYLDDEDYYGEDEEAEEEDYGDEDEEESYYDDNTLIDNEDD